MKGFARTDRLASQIKRALSEIMISNSDLLSGLIISITDVELTKDIRYAKVFYSVLGDQNAREMAVQFFEKHAKTFRMAVSSQIRVKFVPEFKYIFDTSLEYGQRIDQLLDQIKNDQEQS